MVDSNPENLLDFGNMPNYLVLSLAFYRIVQSRFMISNSVQAEKKKIATTTFLDAWDLRSHMAGHFHLWHAVFSYHPGLLGPSS